MNIFEHVTDSVSNIFTSSKAFVLPYLSQLKSFLQLSVGMLPGCNEADKALKAQVDAGTMQPLQALMQFSPGCSQAIMSNAQKQ